MKKLGLQLLIFTLLVSIVPMQPMAAIAETVDLEYGEEKVVLFSEVKGEEINLFEDVTAGEPFTTIQDDTEVILLTVEDEEFSLIRYIYIDEQDEEQIVEGYVHNSRLVPVLEAEQYKELRDQAKEEVEELDEIEATKETTEESLVEENDLEIADIDKVEDDPSNVIEEQIVEENANQFNIAGFSTNIVRESNTSRLGHIRSQNVNIYNEINGKSFKAGSQHTNAVYYIKKQAVLGKETYYLISNNPSSVKGIIGWVKSKDLSTHPHVGVDKSAKTFYIKGNGKATSKAWGGSKDTVYANLSKYKNQPFQVHLTEKVGGNIWYRGVLDGKTVWLHSSYVESPKESKTSLLGHIRSQNVDIYKQINGTLFKASEQYTNVVYYIKKQAVLGNETYYLISTKPSSVNGVVGWVKSSDLSTHSHVGVDKKSKTFYIKGNGKATTKTWGGSKDTVYADLSKYKHQLFQVNSTEQVGNNLWYRGVLNGKTVWLHSSYVESPKESKTSLLGHIRSQNVDIYKQINGTSFKASEQYTNAVYYIKKQAVLGSQTYYLISTEPSSVNGVVGWVKPSDLTTHLHVGVDKKSKTFYIKGNGKATTKTWGGIKDTVFATLSQYKNEAFKVNSTEKVGNNLWYRGTLNGQTVWLHSSYVEEAKGIKTSKLGHIRNSNVQIYGSIGGNSFSAGSLYTNAVYYIKLERKVNDQTYYLISKEPSSVNGVVGWVKSSDLSTHSHVGVDKKSKTFHLNGNGKATTKVWGGSKDIIYSSLSNYKNQVFKVNSTEKVGNNIWYRGMLSGRTVWLHSSYLISANSSTSKVIIIDAGHGDTDPGASGNGVVEKSLTLDISKRTQRLLEAAGYQVIMTRTTDEFLELAERSKIANTSNADIFISIHGNSYTDGSAKGIETYWNQTNEAQKSGELARLIQGELIDETNGVNRGVKQGDFHVIRETKIPSSLVEVGFISNADDAANLKKSSYKEKIAKGIVSGINKYFQLFK